MSEYDDMRDMSLFRAVLRLVRERALAREHKAIRWLSEDIENLKGREHALSDRVAALENAAKK